MNGRDGIALMLALTLIVATGVYAIAQQLVIYSDKPTYTVGDTITISGVGPADEVLAFKVLLDDSLVALGQLSIDSNGLFTTTIPQPRITDPGTYTLTIIGNVDLGTTTVRNTTTFIYIVPSTETTENNTINTTNTITIITTTVITTTVTETVTITETKTTTIENTVTTTKTDTITVTNTTTITETMTTTVKEIETQITTVTETETVTQTQTVTSTATKTVTETETVTTIREHTTIVTTTITAPALLQEKIIYLVVGLLVGAALIYVVRTISGK